MFTQTTTKPRHGCQTCLRFVMILDESRSFCAAVLDPNVTGHLPFATAESFFLFLGYMQSMLPGHMRLPFTFRPDLNQHRCSAKPNKKPVEFHERLSAGAIVLSVAITLLEACYISSDAMRKFSNTAQAVFAFTFCVLQVYGFQCYTKKRGLPCTESLWNFFFLDSDANWNMCDLVLNFVSILDMFLDTFEGRFVHALAAMRVIRIVRIVRLIRLLGSSKFVDDFSKVSHIAGWQMLNFLAVILSFLLVLSVCATNMLWDFPDAEVAACYGNLGTTMWTLFKIMTMDGWVAKAEPVIMLHPSTLYFYAVFVFLSLSSVSIVPAIFIDILLEDRDRARKKRRAARRRGRKSHHAHPYSSRLSQHPVGLTRTHQEHGEDDDISCHSDSASSHTSDELDMTYHRRAESRSDFVLDPNDPVSVASVWQSSGYHLIRSNEDEVEVKDKDLPTIGLKDDAFADCVCRCAQLSAELRLIQANLEVNLQMLLSKVQAHCNPMRQPEFSTERSSVSSARRKSRRASQATRVAPDETPTLRLPDGQGKEATRCSVTDAGDASDHASCLAQRLDPDSGQLSSNPI